MVACAVTPAKAGVQDSIKRMDSGFHRNDAVAYDAAKVNDIGVHPTAVHYKKANKIDGRATCKRCGRLLFSQYLKQKIIRQ